MKQILDGAQVKQFTEHGYVILPELLPDELVARLKPEVDWWVDSGMRAQSIAACIDPEAHGVPAVVECELAAHGELIAYPPLMHTLAQLIGDSFVFHHLHTDRQPPDVLGKAWHHDYEQGPLTDRNYLMVHALAYLDGLDAEVASLVVLPGSHTSIEPKGAQTPCGTDSLPGEVVIQTLPRGSVVVLHSALLHARRARPQQPQKPRYFTDASYCQVGTLWPPVKPYWRHILDRARELDLGSGRWPELFSERHFSEYVDPRMANRAAAS